MKNPVFTGAGVAIITPMYEDGSINFDELGRIIEDQIAHHTDAIIICGTTGECSTPMRSSLPPSSIRWMLSTTACPSLQALAPTILTTAAHWPQSLPNAAQTLC